MKRLFIVLLISGLAFTACNNSAENKPAEDSLTVEPTTTAPVTNPADTMVNLDTANEIATDTAVH